MIWIFIFFSLLIGILIGSILMYWRSRKVFDNQTILYNELQNNKTKIKEYQSKLNDHFTCNIHLLNKIAKNYRQLYQNMTNSASLFSTNTHTQNKFIFHKNEIHNENDDTSSINVDTPRDYSDNIEIIQKKSSKTE